MQLEFDFLKEMEAFKKYLFRKKPREIEEIIVRAIFIKYGEEMTLTGATRDGGFDAIGFNGVTKILLDCKHSTKKYSMSKFRQFKHDNLQSQSMACGYTRLQLLPLTLQRSCHKLR